MSNPNNLSGDQSLEQSITICAMHCKLGKCSLIASHVGLLEMADLATKQPDNDELDDLLRETSRLLANGCRTYRVAEMINYHDPVLNPNQTID